MNHDLSKFVLSLLLIVCPACCFASNKESSMLAMTLGGVFLGEDEGQNSYRIDLGLIDPTEVRGKLFSFITQLSVVESCGNWLKPGLIVRFDIQEEFLDGRIFGPVRSRDIRNPEWLVFDPELNEKSRESDLLEGFPPLVEISANVMEVRENGKGIDGLGDLYLSIDEPVSARGEIVVVEGLAHDGLKNGDYVRFLLRGHLVFDESELRVDAVRVYYFREMSDRASK